MNRIRIERPLVYLLLCIFIFLSGLRESLSSSSSMGKTTSVAGFIPILLLVLFPSVFCFLPSDSDDPPPTPAPWPHQFHSILFMNYSGALQLIDLWYDWPNGRNFNIIRDQLGGLLYDLEWNNGTSFIYTLDESKKCRTAQLEVGILRPNWLDGARYLGQEHVDGFLCNVWEKVEFIWYYEDVVTKRPVHWVFYTGRSAHVMSFEVGAVLEDEKWQAPVYCFEKKNEDEPRLRSVSAIPERSSRNLLGF